jgi:hypothetical protein
MSRKIAQAPAPAIVANGSANPNCVKSITESATETIRMLRSTRPSRGPEARRGSGNGAPAATGSTFGGAPADGLGLSCLLMVFNAANRFVFHKLRRPGERDAMSVERPITMFHEPSLGLWRLGGRRGEAITPLLTQPPVQSRKSALDLSPTHPNRLAV